MPWPKAASEDQGGNQEDPFLGMVSMALILESVSLEIDQLASQQLVLGRQRVSRSQISQFFPFQQGAGTRGDRP